MENLEEALFRTPAQRWLSLTRKISEMSRRLARAGMHIMLALVAAAAALGLAYWNGWIGAARREAPPWALPPPQVRTAKSPSAAESPLPAPWRAAPAPPKILVVPEKVSKASKPPVPEPEEEAPEAPAAPPERPRLVQARNFVDVASELPAIAGEGHPQTYDGILRRFDGVAASRQQAAPQRAAVPNFARPAAAAAEPTEAPREREPEAAPESTPKPDVLKLAAPALGGGAAPSRSAMREIEEGERARAARAAVLAWEERQRWEKLLLRLKLGLGAMVAALAVGFYLSGVWRGLRRPDLSHLTDKDRPSPYQRPGDGK